MSAPWLLLLPVAAFAAASAPPVDGCPDLYETCLETCRVDHGLEKSRRKLTRCVHRCETRRARCASDGPPQPGPRRDDASNAVVRHIAVEPGAAAPAGSPAPSAEESPGSPAPGTPGSGAGSEESAGAKERPASAGAVAPGGDSGDPRGAKPPGGDAAPAAPAIEHSQSVVAPRSTSNGAAVPAAAGTKPSASGASQPISPDAAFERGGEL